MVVLPYLTIEGNIHMGSTQEPLEDTQEPLLFEDYFNSPEAPGVEIEVMHKGKVVRLRVKKSLTLDEMQQATDAGVAIALDKEGNPTITKMNQGAYSKAIVLAGVRSWPFTNPDGSPVPFTKANVNIMDGVLAEKIATAILGNRAVQQQAIVPFAEKLKEDS